jgi:hypothetical protein
MIFQLDTSGTIRLVPAKSDPDGPIYRWSDLSPFAQGYIEALFADTVARIQSGQMAPMEGPRRWPDFSDLDPEALARIIADCEAAGPAEPRAYTADALRRMGAEQWKRSTLTIQLGDDGKVRFA